MVGINQAELQAAAHGLIQAVVLGHELAEPLQALMSAGRSSGGCFIRTTKTDFFATPCLSLVETYRQFRSGMFPTEYIKLILGQDPAPRFERDLDPTTTSYSQHEFYEDFCLRNGIARSVRVRVLASHPGYHRFNFFRDMREAPFEDEELRHFDALAPFLDATAAVCASNFSRQAEAQANLFLHRGLAAFSLARDGAVLEANAPAQAVVPDLLDIVRGRLTARLPGEQKRIDAAIQSAVSATSAPAMVRLNGANLFENPLLLTLPITGEARDVFSRTAGFALVLDVAQKLKVAPKAVSLLSSCLLLTGRESDVVGLVAAGQNLGEAAAQLNIGLGTARGHLKMAMQKAGVHSQVELATLVAKLDGLLP